MLPFIKYLKEIELSQTAHRCMNTAHHKKRYDLHAGSKSKNMNMIIIFNTYCFILD
jgi:hypothetical protein